jgi:hypothetical protein
MHALIVGEAEEEEALCGSDYGFDWATPPPATRVWAHLDPWALRVWATPPPPPPTGVQVTWTWHSFFCVPVEPSTKFSRHIWTTLHIHIISVNVQERRGLITDSLTPYIPPHERGWICSLVVKYPLTLTALWFIMDVYVHDNLCYLVLYKWVRTISRGDIPKMHFLTWPPPSPGPCVLGMPRTLGLYPRYNKLGY